MTDMLVADALRELFMVFAPSKLNLCVGLATRFLYDSFAGLHAEGGYELQSLFEVGMKSW